MVLFRGDIERRNLVLVILMGQRVTLGYSQIVYPQII